MLEGEVYVKIALASDEVGGSDEVTDVDDSGLYDDCSVEISICVVEAEESWVEICEDTVTGSGLGGGGVGAQMSMVSVSVT